MPSCHCCTEEAPITLFRIGFTALILVVTACVAAAQDVKIGSTSIKLLPPQDQCEVSDQKGNEARLLGKLRELLAGRNQLLAAYADCRQLADLRSGKRTTFDDFAQYMAPTNVLNEIVPAHAISKLCALMRTRGDQSLATIAQNRTSDIERMFPGLKMNEIKFLGVLTEEPSACYTGQLQKMTTEQGAEKVQVTVVATVMLKGKLFTYQQYGPYRGSDTISDLLRKHRASVAALIAVNTR